MLYSKKNVSHCLTSPTFKVALSEGYIAILAEIFGDVKLCTMKLVLYLNIYMTLVLFLLVSVLQL